MVLGSPFLCVECRLPVGVGTGVDVYKHTLNCMHLLALGRDNLLATYGAGTDEYSKRVVEMLHESAKQGEVH